MRIVTWNVNRAFPKKTQNLLGLKPDLAIIPEACRDIKIDGYSFQWIGQDPNTGLGFAARDGINASPFSRIATEEMWYGSTRITDPDEITIVGIWASYDGTPAKTEQGPTLRVLDEILTEIEGSEALVLGDFNNGAYWDAPGRADNFSNLVDQLEKAGLVSAYHSFFQEEYGEESRPTYYQSRKQESPYHIDYCFLTKGLSERMESFSVGSYEEWGTVSDHMPLILDLRDS